MPFDRDSLRNFEKIKTLLGPPFTAFTEDLMDEDLQSTFSEKNISRLEKDNFKEMLVESSSLVDQFAEMIKNQRTLP